MGIRGKVSRNTLANANKVRDRRIKKFRGTSANAVKTQIWIAISVYVPVAIIKKRLNLDMSLYTILQILSVSLFEKTPILQAFSPDDYENEEEHRRNQLMLFD